MSVETKFIVTAILFDLDNTLYDQREAQKHIILAIARQYPDVFAGIADETIIDAFRKADTTAIAEFNTGAPLDTVRRNRSRRLLNMLGVDETITDEITRKFIDGYSTVICPIPDSERVVKLLHAKYKIGMITNGSPDVQAHKLASLGIMNHMDCKMYSESLGIRKPDPRIFLAAAKALDVAPANCLFVGDSYEDDIAGSKKAGMHACWLNRHNAPVPADRFHDIEISCLRELLDVL